MSDLEVVEQSNSSLSSSGQLDDAGPHQMEDGGVAEGPSQLGVTSSPMLDAENSTSGPSAPANTGHQREQDGTSPRTGNVW